MSKFKFLEASAVPPIAPAGLITEECCLTALTSYRSNAMLAVGPTTLPAFVFWMSMEWTAASTKASAEIAGPNALPHLIVSSMQRIGPLAEKYMEAAMRLNRDQQVAHLVEKTAMFERFATDSGNYAEEVLSNLLKSIVVQAWTAMEVLIEDLLTEAREELPETFAHITGNLRFRSRKAFRGSYEKAFTHDDSQIVTALHHEAIDALALLRNVIVHCAALADNEFISEAKKTPLLSAYWSLEETNPVFVDGQTLSRIVDSAFKAGYDLVSAVDRWLKAHKIIPPTP